MLSERGWNIGGWIAVAIFFGCLLIGVARSQQPPQTPGVQTNQQSNGTIEGQTKPDEQTDRSPNPATIIPIVPPPSLDKKTSQCCSQGAEEASEYWPFPFLGRRLKITDSLLALFTFFLVAIGAWQGSHLRATVEAIVSGERPYIYPGRFVTGALLPSGAHAIYPLAANVPFPEIEWAFMNVGKTPGIIKEIRGELFLGTRFPRRPTFTYSHIVSAEWITRGGQETDPIVFPFNRNLTLDEINGVGTGAIRFRFFGYVKYADSFRRLHTKGFEFVVRVHPRNRAEPMGGRRYNYSKSQKIPRRYDT